MLACCYRRPDEGLIVQNECCVCNSRTVNKITDMIAGFILPATTRFSGDEIDFDSLQTSTGTESSIRNAAKAFGSMQGANRGNLVVKDKVTSACVSLRSTAVLIVSPRDCNSASSLSTTCVDCRGMGVEIGLDAPDLAEVSQWRVLKTGQTQQPRVSKAFRWIGAFGHDDTVLGRLILLKDEARTRVYQNSVARIEDAPSSRRA